MRTSHQRSYVRAALVAGFLAAIGSIAAHAQTAAQPAPAPAAAPTATEPARSTGTAPRIGQACKLDIVTHCSTAEKGGGGRMKCLVDNKAKLAPDCAAALDAQNDARHARRSACHTEIQSLCGDTKGPARRACVETNAAKLSAECATRFQKQAERRQSGPGAATQPKQQ